jgi:hypothetical protein
MKGFYKFMCFYTVIKLTASETLEVGFFLSTLLLEDKDILPCMAPL